MNIKAFIFICFVITSQAEDRNPTNGVNTWENYKSVGSIELVEPDSDKTILCINLLELAPVIQTAKGGFDSDDDVVKTYHANTPSHGFVATSDGDLFIDNQYAGRFKSNDKLVYGANKLWSNGVPCNFKTLTPLQTKNLYGDVEGVVEADGTKLVNEGKWTIYLKPANGGGVVNGIANNFLFMDGMTIIFLDKDHLVVNGIMYGSITPDQKIKVCDGIVKVNEAVRSPVGVFQLKK